MGGCETKNCAAAAALGIRQDSAVWAYRQAAAAAAMDAYDSRVVLKQLFSTATDAKAKGLGIEEEVIAQIKVRGYWQQWRCGRRTN